MNTYIIILKLTSQEDLYTNLISFLRSGVTWARPLPGIWMIKTTTNTAEVRNGIKSRIGAQDSVMVIDISKKGWATSNITKTVTDWMKTNI